jgi:hypothetical protein
MREAHRPAPAPFRSWTEGETCIAYHPRLHTNLGVATVYEDFWEVVGAASGHAGVVKMLEDSAGRPVTPRRSLVPVWSVESMALGPCRNTGLCLEHVYQIRLLLLDPPGGDGVDRDAGGCRWIRWWSVRRRWTCTRRR